MTGEERKALSFVALLLGLSVVARAVNRPDTVLASGATTVQIQDRLQQNQQVRERVSKPAKPSHATPPKPPVSSVPAWRRAGASIIEYKPGPAASFGPLDLNRATAEQLDQLAGVSPALAQRIVEYRTAAGGRFREVEQLDSVKGVGPALLTKLRPLVKVR